MRGDFGPPAAVTDHNPEKALALVRDLVEIVGPGKTLVWPPGGDRPGTSMEQPLTWVGIVGGAPDNGVYVYELDEQWTMAINGLPDAHRVELPEKMPVYLRAGWIVFWHRYWQAAFITAAGKWTPVLSSGFETSLLEALRGRVELERLKREGA